MTTLVDLYLRLSDGHDLTSIDSRVQKLRREVCKRSWVVHRIVIENDLTVGKRRNASAFKRHIVTLPSGRKAKRTIRPGFRSILDDIANGSVQAVFAEDLDRIARDPRDGEDLLDVVEMAKATVDSVSGSLRLTNGGTDQEIGSFRDAVNHAYKSSTDTARRVRESCERRAYEGIWFGGPRPFGFTPVPHPEGKYQNTVLEVNEVEAAEIRKWADQVLTKVPLRSIARDLREREHDVPTVTGTQWTAKTVRDILLRPVNAGIVVYDGQETEVRLPGKPILDEDVWRAVVAELTDPTRSTPGSKAPRWLGTGIYLCICGAAMEIQPGGAKRNPAYRCSLRAKPADSVHVRRDAEALDGFVAKLVIERMSRPDAAELVAPAAPAGVDVNALRAEVAMLRQREIDLGVEFAEGRVPMPAFNAATKRIAALKGAAEQKLASQTDRSPLTPLITAEDVAAKWGGMPLGGKRAVVKELMTVRILPTRRTRGFDPKSIEVTWK